MGLINQKPAGKSIPVQDVNKLTKEELEILLTAIGKANLNIQGSQFELLYNAIVKLQNQYFEVKEL